MSDKTETISFLVSVALNNFPPSRCESEQDHDRFCRMMNAAIRFGKRHQPSRLIEPEAPAGGVTCGKSSG